MDTQIELKQLIESKYGELEKLDPTRRSEVFNEMYKDLVFVMRRDFNLVQQITEVNFN